MSNYNLEPCFVESKQIHIYHGVARENQLDHRFFIRGLIRPGRLRDSMSTADYLISETDRRVTSIPGCIGGHQRQVPELRLQPYLHELRLQPLSHL